MSSRVCFKLKKSDANLSHHKEKRKEVGCLTISAEMLRRRLLCSLLTIQPSPMVHPVTLSRQIVSVWHVSITCWSEERFRKGLLSLIKERVAGWGSTAWTRRWQLTSTAEEMCQPAELWLTSGFQAVSTGLALSRKSTLNRLWDQNAGLPLVCPPAVETMQSETWDCEIAEETAKKTTDSL